MLFSTLKEETAPQPYDFLSRTQAVEGILRPLSSGTYVPEAEFEQVHAAVLAAIPADTDPSLRQALKDRLRFGNEWSLRRRLKEGLQVLSPDLQSMVLGTQRLAEFVGSTVEGRNFWTHYDENEKAVPLTIPEASIAASRLLCLGVVTLLRQVGFNDEEIHARMTETYSFLPVLGAYSFREFPSGDILERAASGSGGTAKAGSEPGTAPNGVADSSVEG